jgi:hypothetical protein
MVVARPETLLSAALEKVTRTGGSTAPGLYTIVRRSLAHYANERTGICSRRLGSLEANGMKELNPESFQSFHRGDPTPVRLLSWSFKAYPWPT